MIDAKDLVKIGRLHKTHGVKGEITLVFEKPEYASIDTDYYFIDIDGISVPFFIEDTRVASSVSTRVRFENVTDESRAARLCNALVYIERDKLKIAAIDEAADWDVFIGYRVVDETGEEWGEIVAVDAATINVLFLIENTQTEEKSMIPATADFIQQIDHTKQAIYMVLPQGLKEI